MSRGFRYLKTTAEIQQVLDESDIDSDSDVAQESYSDRGYTTPESDDSMGQVGRVRRVRSRRVRHAPPARPHGFQLAAATETSSQFSTPAASPPKPYSLQAYTLPASSSVVSLPSALTDEPCVRPSTSTESARALGPLPGHLPPSPRALLVPSPESFSSVSGGSCELATLEDVLRPSTSSVATSLGALVKQDSPSISDSPPRVFRPVAPIAQVSPLVHRQGSPASPRTPDSSDSFMLESPTPLSPGDSSIFDEGMPRRSEALPRARRRGRSAGRPRGAGVRGPAPRSPGRVDRENGWMSEGFNPPIHPFTGAPGLNVPCPTSPLQFFQLLFTREMLCFLVYETNRYADLMAAEAMGEMPGWTMVSEIDTAKFLGLFMFMGIVKFPEISQYWSTEPLFYHPIYGQTMSVNRFKAIMRFFHSYNNKAVPRDNTDRLIKVRTVMEYFTERFRMVYTPEQHLSLDEGCMAWRGRLSFKVYQPNKPDKYSVKLFILAEAGSGYVCDFEVYSGMYKSTRDTVCDLIRPLMHKGYKLYMDNYYNSVALCESLFSVGVNVCGTLRLVRGAPKELQLMAKRKMREDTLVSRHKGNVMVLLWKDKRVVPMITTFHNDTTIPKVRRSRVKVQGRRTLQLKEINKPVVVEDYNQHMSGVDHFDQMVKYYHFTRRTQKWTKKMLFYFLQMAVFNAYVLYNKFTSDTPKLTLLHFHVAIIKALINFDPNEWPLSGHGIHHAPDLVVADPDLPPAAEADSAPHPGHLAQPPPPPAAPAAPAAAPAAPARPHSPQAGHQRQAAAPRPRDLSVEGPPVKRRRTIDSNDRLRSALGHSLVKIADKKRLRCRVCTRKGLRKDTSYHCPVCDVALCLGNCYAAYHSAEQYWV